MEKKNARFAGKKYIIAAICLMVVCASCSQRRSGRKEHPTYCHITAKVREADFMRFFSKNVAETFYHEATGYHYIVYDMDAGMDNELLQVDAENWYSPAQNNTSNFTNP